MNHKSGERLREERERLGLTQLDFSQRTGISSRSLRNYENGTRVPDVHYLYATKELGVDVHYVVTGVREEEHDNFIKANAHTLLLLTTMLGFDSDDLNEVCQLAMDDLAAEKNTPYDSSKAEKLIKKLEGLLVRSPRVIMMCGNAEAIARDIELFEQILIKVGQGLPREKRTRVIAMLYRSFKASGKIDEKMIEDAISLAT